MIRFRHLLLAPGAVFTALVVSLGTPAATAKGKHRHVVGRHLSPKQQATTRRQLRARLRRNPRAALTPDFLARAEASGLTLPLTLRLNRVGQVGSDDELRVQWDDSTWAWPDPFVPLEPRGGGLIALDGRSSIEAQFGNDLSGYGGSIGAVETTNGASLNVTGAAVSPIDVTTTAACPSVGVSVQLENMDLSTGESTHGLLSLFGGTARASLHARVGTTTRAINSTDCSGTLGSSPDSRHNATSTDPIVPINFDAVFRISPSVTADGQLRLGVLTVSDGSVQPTTFARITLCVQPAPDPDTCQTAQFPARVSIKQMNAEVLLGDLPS